MCAVINILVIVFIALLSLQMQGLSRQDEFLATYSTW